MDVFERIRQLISPTNVKPQQPLNSNTQKGLEAISQIRGSLNIPQPKSVATDFNLQTYSPLVPKTPTIQSRFEPTPLKAVQPQLGIKPEPQMSVMPKIKPQEVMSVKPQPLKAVPFQTFTPRVPEAETPFGKFVVGKGVLPLNEGFRRIETAWKNTDNKGGLERTLDGVSGVGLIASIPNEVFIQPIWDSIKLGVKGIRTGEITQNDIDRFLFTSGGEKGTIFEAFGTNEDEFGKNYGQVALGVARFADFAPELINIPGTQVSKADKVTTFAREVKLTGKGAKEVASKGKKVDDAIKNFETKIGKKLDNATKTEIKKTVNNPTPFLERLKGGLEVTRRTEQAQGVNFTDELLIQEASKYKNADEFFLKMPQATRDVLRNKNIKSQEAIKNWFNENASKVQVQDISKSVKPYTIEKPLTLYHVTSFENKANILNQGFKKGSELPEEAFRGGGYGKVQDSISFAENPKSASMFAQNSFNTLFEVKLKPTVKIIDRKDITKAEDLNDEIPKLLEQKIDAVRIDSGEDEIVIINKNAIDKITKSVDFKATDAKNIENIIKKESETISKKLEPEVKLTTTVENIKASIKKGIPPANVSNLTSLGQKVVSNAQKERRFAKTTVAGAERTAKETKKILDEANDLYSPLNNKSAFADAERFVNSNSTQDVLNRMRSSQDSRDITYLGQALMNKMQKIGDYNGESQVALEVSQRATELGQAIQALSIWKKLSPTGAKIWAQKEITRANEALGLKEGAKGFIKLTDQDLKEIGEQASKIGKATDEYDKSVQTALLANLIGSKIPKELGSKIATIQTIAQLLNPKTLIRNVAGNMIFSTLEAVSNAVATPLDLAVALFTKKRGIANLNPVGFGKGFADGFKKGVNESLLGIDTLNSSALNSSVQNGFIFQSKIMQGLEKALNLALKPFDRAFYEANYRATLEGLMKANKTDVPTQEMIEQAHYMGLYRTFQDENVATNIFTGLKRVLNMGYDFKTKKAVVKPFGLGDLIIKYAKVPANLMMRAVDYSPVGYAKAVFELAQPLFKKEFNQAEFVNAISRASVGTFGLMNTGYILGKLGLITPKPDSSKDVRNAQQLDGIRSYAFNISAIKRYVASGFDPEAAKKMEGDELFSYDWAQPASIGLAMGANWAETEKLKKNSAQERLLASFGAGGVAFADAMNTLTDQPVLQGLKTTFSPQGLVQGLIDTVKGAPASFVPTVLNQINQLTDNTRRETFDPNILEESKNIAIAKVPFLSQSLPPRYDILGRPAERYQGGTNTFVNVMLNPAFVSKIGSDESLKEVIRLYEVTDETSVIPNSVDKKVKINGEDVMLTGQQMTDYQREIGTKSNDLIRKMLQNEDYYKLPDDVKASLIAKGLSNINSATKINMFGDRPKDISFDVNLLQNNQMDNYIYKNVTDAILDQPKKEMSVKLDQLEVLLKGQRNPQEISKYIIDNKIPQTSISSVISKIKKDEVFSQLPAELQKYNGLSNSQLEDLKTLKPQLSSDIIRYQQISKTYDNIANAQIGFYKALGTKKPSLRGRIKKPKKGRNLLAGLKPKKPSKISLKPKKPKGLALGKVPKLKLPKIKNTTKFA